MIPKKIHYIWFGRQEKSQLIKHCIETWKKLLPDWEIIEWNEDNYDINSSNYIKEAYSVKKYAFAADYARFDILYKHGGVYLDTDVELIKPIPEEFLKNAGITGVESEYSINPGLIFGSEKGNKIVKEILDEYDKAHFLISKKENLKTVVTYTTDVFKKYGFVQNNKTQCIKGIKVYPMEYFCCYDADTKEFHITDKTISVHRYANSWGSKKSKRTLKIKMFIKRIIGIERYKKLLSLKRALLGVSKK